MSLRGSRVRFRGEESAGPASATQLPVDHGGHAGRDGADGRIVALIGALPDPAGALVCTSDAKLRARLHAPGARVSGARTLLNEIAAGRATPTVRP